MTDPMERAMTVFFDPAQLAFRSPELRSIWADSTVEVPPPTVQRPVEEPAEP